MSSSPKAVVFLLLVLAALVGCNAAPSAPAEPTAEPTVAAAASEVLITMQRTMCFGFCPAYTVSITGEGEVQYTGERCVKETGEQSATIAPEAVQELVAEFEKIDFFALQDEYTAEVTDLPSTTVTITLDDRHKSVLDYHGAPEALQVLERKIDEVANTAQWTGGEPKPEYCDTLHGPEPSSFFRPPCVREFPRPCGVATSGES